MRKLALCLMIVTLTGLAACGKRGAPIRPGTTGPAAGIPETIHPTSSSPQTDYPLPGSRTSN
ncbi:hypothetical protein [Zavarzinia aquatilis]|uniref:Argininosuccinate lyase n=1 Tax=Zavarzinia aquatilis TaxID=2211142 RepID=A0A317EI72_9PROT|nr:hypothetical protein [Zavarzinia aquatilis]PWR25123.1 hypothetical protein DKG74_04990 [Zavarzinia aquatilis]